MNWSGKHSSGKKYKSRYCTDNNCEKPTCSNAYTDFRDEAGSQANDYLVEPRFDLDGKSTYGDYGGACIPPGNRHFIPRRAKLKAAGGRSISLYEKWRLMQYHTNCIMKRFMDGHSVNVSVLPPCVNYDLWKHPKWKLLYDKPLDEDPCPDCDVRFSADADGIYRPKIAPASILLPGRWRRRLYSDTIILIGLPQHITVAYMKETPSHVYVEYVDPAGPSGDRRGSEEVQLWMHQYLGPRLGKPIKFYQAAKGINFQLDKNDVMCQTWIWYWVYFRLVRRMTSDAMARHVYQLGIQGKSLNRIHRYNCWLSDLHKLGFYTTETASQTRVAVEMTPARPHPTARPEKKRSRMQVALKKIIKKTSNTCFSKSYAYDSSDDDSDSDVDDLGTESSSCSSGDYDGNESRTSMSTDDMTD